MGSKVLATTRKAVGAGLLATGLSLAIGCVSLLDLNDYVDAAQVLCDHLQQCYGATEYPCVAHVAEGLAEGSAEARQAWLTSVLEAECVAQCSAGKLCLDSSPVCNEPGDGCADEEQCCGFLDKAQTCEGDACCRPDGLSCDAEGQCCTECDFTTKTCGGEAPCAPKGEPCEEQDDCCSDNCLPEGVCGFRCREQGEDCGDGSECCSGICEGSRCACLPEGSPCDDADQCCLGQCYLGLCNADPGCLTPLDPGCASSALECCQIDGADEITCNPQENRCCLVDGSTVGTSEADSSSFCCSGASSDGTCCGDVMGRCNADSCCPGLVCRPSAATGDTECCYPPQCNNPCEEQDAPMASGSAGGDCSDVVTITPGCLQEVCKIFPECCCEEWTAYCAGLLLDPTNALISECAGICNNTLDPNQP